MGEDKAAIVNLTAIHVHLVTLFSAGPEDPYQSESETVGNALRKGRGQKDNGKSDCSYTSSCHVVCFISSSVQGSLPVRW